MMQLALFEAAVICAFVAGGALACHALGLRRWAAACVAPAMGLALYLVVALLAVATPLGFDGPAILAASVLAPAALFAERAYRQRRSPVRSLVEVAALCAVTYIISIAIFPLAYMLSSVHHTDTVGYLNIGSLIYSGAVHDNADAWTLLRRPMAFGALHAPANAVGEYFLRIMNPFIAVSTLVFMGWTVFTGLRGRLRPATLIALIAAMTLALVSANRFVYHSFYLNGHLLAGLLMLMIAGAGWLRTTRTPPAENALTALQALAVAALAITRPEGSLLAAVALAPTLVDGRLSPPRRIFLAVMLGLSQALWQAHIVIVSMRTDYEIAASTYAMLGLGLFVSAGAFLLRFRFVTGRPRLWLVLCEAGLWALLAALALRSPEILSNSVSAMTQNLDIFWGWFAYLVAALFVGLAAATDDATRVFLRFPASAFVPLMLLLGYMREKAYRVGGGDSLNRMTITVVPLAVVFIAAAAASRRRRLRPAPDAPA